MTHVSFPNSVLIVIVVLSIIKSNKTHIVDAHDSKFVFWFDAHDSKREQEVSRNKWSYLRKINFSALENQLINFFVQYKYILPKNTIIDIF